MKSYTRKAPKGWQAGTIFPLEYGGFFLHVVTGRSVLHENTLVTIARSTLSAEPVTEWSRQPWTYYLVLPRRKQARPTRKAIEEENRLVCLEHLGPVFEECYRYHHPAPGKTGSTLLKTATGSLSPVMNYRFQYRSTS